MVVGMMKCSSSGASELVIANGLISAAIPIDNNGSVILEPIKVPIATPSLFLAAIKAIVNSGSEVPNPEMVEPIVECDGGECCDNGCEGEVKKVHVKCLKTLADWGEFNYCDNAIKEDINRGFSVDILEA